MEKQELKHIQPYPIGGENALRVKFIDSNYKKHHNQNITDTGIIVGLNIWNITNSTLLSIESSSNGLRHSCTLDEIKPILRPMSDLCKPLEDGTIPAIELAKLSIANKKYDRLLVDKSGDPIFEYRIITKPFGKVLKVTNADQWIVYLSFEKPLNSPYFQIEYLIKKGFDVFGLIPKLAIDCNELKINKDGK